MEMDLFLGAASVVLIFLAVLAFVCAWELVRIARIRPSIGAADDRAHAAVLAAVGGTIGGFLGFNRIFDLGVDNGVAVVLLVVAVATVSLPSVLWLNRYRPDLLIRAFAVALTGGAISAAVLLVTE